MTPTEVVAVIGVIVAVIGTITIPLWLNRRKEKADKDAADVESWDRLTGRLETERNRMAEELRVVEDRYKKIIADIRAEYEAQLAAAHAKIDQLEIAIRVLRHQSQGGASS